jgi:hypothetical protein
VSDDEQEWHGSMKVTGSITQPDSASAHVTDGHLVLIAGDVAYVINNEKGYAYAINVPSAVVAMARKLRNEPEESK